MPTSKYKLQKISEGLLEEKYLECIDHFVCSDNKQVEDFLKNEALSLMKKNLVRTRLFFGEDQKLIGFYSMFNDTFAMQKNKREELDIILHSTVKHIPAIRLHYIGVDDQYRGKGYGSYMMMSVMVNAVKIALLSGCPLITLESTEKAKPFYEKWGFKYICRTRCGAYCIMAISTKPFITLMDERK